MSKSDILVAFLRANKGQYFCDRCLSEKTGITPLAQVNQLARPLEHAKEYRRIKTTCSGCTEDRVALGYFGEWRNSKPVAMPGFQSSPLPAIGNGQSQRPAMRKCRFCKMSDSRAKYAGNL
jgi:hypothetical protein